MKYPKLNFLIISRILLICIFIYGIYYFNNKAINFYEIEVEKNLQTEISISNLNELESFKLKTISDKKVSVFSDNLNYLFLIIIFGFAFINFLSHKIKSENKRLDKIEGEENE